MTLFDGLWGGNGGMLDFLGDAAAKDVKKVAAKRPLIRIRLSVRDLWRLLTGGAVLMEAAGTRIEIRRRSRGGYERYESVAAAVHRHLALRLPGRDRGRVRRVWAVLPAVGEASDE